MFVHYTIGCWVLNLSCFIQIYVFSWGFSIFGGFWGIHFIFIPFLSFSSFNTKFPIYSFLTLTLVFKHWNKFQRINIFYLIFHCSTTAWIDSKSFTFNTAMRGTRGVLVIVVGNGHADTSSNPGRDWLHFT